MNFYINEYEYEVYRIIIYKMIVIYFYKIIKFYILVEYVLIIIYVFKGWFISLWYVRSVIDFFGYKEFLKRSKYYN